MPRDVATRLSAALEGRYAIERLLGEGGMATVYLARDERHHRNVALKVLKPELAAVIGADRFLTEIETTAGLQHPNILPLFDSGEADGFLFYVMPYIDGESLRQRLDRERQLPVDEALRIAAEVADALQAAHDHGVVHRDIKPANILLSRGRPMVADFGIALAVSAAGGGRLTETGLSLGTPHYMSPEQATGDRVVGPATDIYALGCVLYEMLVGEPPYTGSTPQAVLGKIVLAEPEPITKHRKSVPPHVESAVFRALEKLAADRFTTVRQFAGALADPAFRHPRSRHSAASAPMARWSGRSAILTSSAISAAAFVAGVALPWPREPPGVARFSLAMPDGQDLATVDASRVAITEDGRTFAYLGQGRNGGLSIWIRSLDRLAGSEIPDMQGARSPSFSPDGERLALKFGNGVRVVTVAGGSSITLSDSVFDDYPGSLDWGPDGFVYLGHRGLLRIPAQGGDWEVVVPQDAQARWVMNPEVLPGGNGALFALGYNETFTSNVIAAADFGTGEIHELTDGVTARYVPTGHLAVVRADGRLDVVPFDATRLEITGPSVTVGGDIGITSWASTDLVISASGTLLYTTGLPEPARQVVWVDRDGSERPVDPDWVGPYETVALSPDGRSLAVGTGFGAEPQLWMKTLDAGPLTRLTREGFLNRRPVWAPDGASIIYISDRGDGREVYRTRSDGVGTAELVLAHPRHVDEADRSPVGDWLVYRVGISGGEGRDIYARHSESDAELAVAADPAYDELTPTLSPDGRRLAYVSAESGRREVYVRSFPDVERRRVQVSVNGGDSPVWAHSGEELFYRQPSSLMAAAVSDDSTFVVGDRTELFSTQPYFLVSSAMAFDVASDDRTFLMIRDAVAMGRIDLIVVQNWFEELRRLTPN